jgi:hypothetical protein
LRNARRVDPVIFGMRADELHGRDLARESEPRAALGSPMPNLLKRLVDATGRAEEPPERSANDPISSSLTVGIEVLSSVIEALRR